MAELVPGTLEMLILRTLVAGPMHGYGIAQRIHNVSDDELRVEEGSLYPALQRLLRKGWVTAEMGQHGTQPARPLLHPDTRRTEAARRRNERIPAVDQSNRARPGA
jgi:DNA-binding PadR family transcriptional regulator